MFVYFICLIVLGLPMVTMEFAIGRASQVSPIKMYDKLQSKGQKWGLFGYFCLIGNVILMSFYTVVCGWIIYYFYSFLTGKNKTLDFGMMTGTPSVNVSFLFITVFITFAVLSVGIQKGLEKITKYMMIVLFVLMIVLTVRSLTLSGAAEGLKFYLLPDFSKITGSVIVGAMNQAFFTLSCGIGCMAIFGSYIGRQRSLLGEAVNVVVLDTLVAVMSGLIIFPSCFTYNLRVNAGPSLLFETMSTVFNNMQGGRWWGTMFFLFMSFAALSTVLAVCENILAMTRELTGLSRRAGCIICAIVIFLISLTTALGYSVLKFHPFDEDSTWLDFWDFILSNNMLPIGSIALTLFCCYKFGWGWDKFIEEVNAGKGLKVSPFMKPIFKYVVPVIVVALYIYGLVTFEY